MRLRSLIATPVQSSLGPGLAIFAGILLIKSPVALAASDVAYGPAPSWVMPQQVPVAPSEKSTEPVRVLLSDVQARLAPKISETYVDSVLLVQTPQGLTDAGNIALSWRPDTDVLTVHKLAISRNGKDISLLGSGQTFTILRREESLEYATLSGALTAVTQPQGLEVGDRIELAYTIKRTDPLLGGVPEQIFGTPPQARIALAHLDVSWPADYHMSWRSPPYLATLREHQSDTGVEISDTQLDQQPLVEPAGAPSRYAATRLVQVSGYKSWSEISRLLYPLFSDAAKLSQSTPLRGEIERLRTSLHDPRARTEAALRLAQDQIRYVSLGMNEARIVPANVDTTWSRRYGDCKAKTVLLLALLRELGVDAEAVVVATVDGDALPTRLPMIGLFNHVLVRARIDGKEYWLDGTRVGDRHLDDLPVPNFRWGLPLKAQGSDLIKIEMVAPPRPLVDTTIVVDASAGPKAPASFHAEMMLRSDVATKLQQTISRLTDTQRNEILRTFWRRQDYWSTDWDDVNFQNVKADFDDADWTLRLSVDGQGTMNWQGNEHLLQPLRLGGVVDLKREPGPNSDAPYLTNLSVYFRVSERVKLPRGGSALTLVGENVDQTIAGMHYERSARIDGGELSADATVRSVSPEFPASEAAADQKQLRELWDHPLYLKLRSD